MQETLFNYQKFYLQLQLVGGCREKEKEYGNWDEETYPREKKRADTDLEFFPDFLLYF